MLQGVQVNQKINQEYIPSVVFMGKTPHLPSGVCGEK
jgi:hypothetical protein